MCWYSHQHLPLFYIKVCEVTEEEAKKIEEEEKMKKEALKAVQQNVQKPTGKWTEQQLLNIYNLFFPTLYQVFLKKKINRSKSLIDLMLEMSDIGRIKYQILSWIKRGEMLKHITKG